MVNAAPGQPAHVNAGVSFSAGALLQTDGSGRPRPASSGNFIVARALEASSGQGDAVWIVFETQREL